MHEAKPRHIGFAGDLLNRMDLLANGMTPDKQRKTQAKHAILFRNCDSRNAIHEIYFVYQDDSPSRQSLKIRELPAFKDWRRCFLPSEVMPGKLEPAEDRGILVLTRSAMPFGSPSTFFTFFQICKSDAW